MNAQLESELKKDEFIVPELDKFAENDIDNRTETTEHALNYISANSRIFGRKLPEVAYMIYYFHEVRKKSGNK